MRGREQELKKHSELGQKESIPNAVYRIKAIH